MAARGCAAVVAAYCCSGGEPLPGAVAGFWGAGGCCGVYEERVACAERQVSLCIVND